MAVHPTSLPVVTVQPGMLRSLEGMKTEAWNSGICDCCQDMDSCCFGFWCPWCHACKVSSEFGECVCMPLVDCIGGGIVPAATLAMRTTMRERYRIRGSMFDDCCIATCCNMCAWCQMARELKLRKRPLVINSSARSSVRVTIHRPHHVPNYPPQPLYPLPSSPYPPVSY